MSEKFIINDFHNSLFSFYDVIQLNYHILKLVSFNYNGFILNVKNELNIIK